MTNPSKNPGYHSFCLLSHLFLGHPTGRGFWKLAPDPPTPTGPHTFSLGSFCCPVSV